MLDCSPIKLRLLTLILFTLANPRLSWPLSLNHFSLTVVALLVVALDMGATVVVVVSAKEVEVGTRSSIHSNHGIPMALLAHKVVGSSSLIPPGLTTGSSNPQPPNGPTILHGTLGPNPSHRPYGSLSTTIGPRLLASWAPHGAPCTSLPNKLTHLSLLLPWL